MCHEEGGEAGGAAPQLSAAEKPRRLTRDHQPAHLCTLGISLELLLINGLHCLSRRRLSTRQLPLGLLKVKRCLRQLRRRLPLGGAIRFLCSVNTHCSLSCLGLAYCHKKQHMSVVQSTRCPANCFQVHEVDRILRQQNNASSASLDSHTSANCNAPWPCAAPTPTGSTAAPASSQLPPSPSSTP